MAPILIGPSILNADLANLAAESKKLLDAGADYLHLDVMDGHFVPNITIGHPVIKCLRKEIPTAFFDAHMMVAEPLKWIEPMQDAGVNQYTFHVEATNDAPLVCRKIREAGMRVGVALKPGTSFTSNSDCDTIMELADTVLIMTVEPGFGGQSFMPDMLTKMDFFRLAYPRVDIQVDGGVNLNNVVDCGNAGARSIVCGTAITGNDNPREVISKMKYMLRNCDN